MDIEDLPYLSLLLNTGNESLYLYNCLDMNDNHVLTSIEDKKIVRISSIELTENYSFIGSSQPITIT